MKKHHPTVSDCNECDFHSLSVFCNLNQDSFKVLEKEKTSLKYKKGSVLFHEGAYPTGVYCIQHGKVKVTVTGDMGREQIVRLARRGDLLGYRAVLGGDKLSASATTLEDSIICFIPKEDFIQIIKSSPEFALDMLRVLSNDVKRSDETITHMAQKPVRERTAEAILLLMDTYGFAADGCTIDVSLSREEVANIIGTAMETAVRFLNEFKKDKIIDLIGKQIVVLNKNELVHVANIYG